jgi:26S proteasome regulatory subunit N2
MYYFFAVAVVVCVCQDIVIHSVQNLTYISCIYFRAKFSATASMGVIHASHTTEAMTLLEPYLPPSAPADDPNAEHPTVSATGGYAEGGSLYALGLIHGSHAGSSTEKRLEASTFLRKHLRNSHANEVISHGAALGVGLTSFGSADLEVVSELKELLYTDSAVAGEAASYAMGMVLVGSGAGNASSSASEELAELVAELRNYSRETQHEKIIRGIAMCLALVNYGQEENADATIEEMRGDRDPIIRYGAMYGLALAYCGTGSNKAIRILLHTAVSDVSDDVRMAAVIGLAFVLHKTPERVPDLVRLLLESFNPHVRYASCMAVGIAMAGTGDSDSVALLEPMLTDMTDYVRQGALLGTSMIYMQQSDTCNHRKIKTFREKLANLVGDKHQTTLTKMGAILSTGLLDAGGRNCVISLGSRNGFTKMTSAAGLVLWLQHWHWYPLMHMFSLAVTPTCTIGLNKDFKYPKKFEIQCNAKPSVFAYPKKLEEKKEEKKKRVETVTLSTTAKSKARLARKKAKEEAESGGDSAESAMDVDKKEEEGEPKKEEGKDEDKAEGMDVDGEGEKEEKPKKKREPEPTSFRISNPSRITKAQAEVCAFDLNQRYRPIRHVEKPYGVIMLTDSTPGEEEDLGAVKTPAAEEEADPPEPFEWTPPGHPDHPDTKVDEKESGKGSEEESKGEEKPVVDSTTAD